MAPYQRSLIVPLPDDDELPVSLPPIEWRHQRIIKMCGLTSLFCIKPELYQYLVQFYPPIEELSIKKKILKKYQEKSQITKGFMSVFDGTLLSTTDEIAMKNKSSLLIDVMHPLSKEPYKMRIMYMKKLKVTEQEWYSLFLVIMRKVMVAEGVDLKFLNGLVPHKGLMIIGYDILFNQYGKILSCGLTTSTSNGSGPYHASMANIQDYREFGDFFLHHFQSSLLSYLKKNDGYPEKIVIFRNKLEENQFEDVMNHEYDLLNKTIDVLYTGDVKPKLLFVLIQKKIKNTLPFNYHFMTLSPRFNSVMNPTNYHVLVNDSDLKIDEIQVLTYKLCRHYGYVFSPEVCHYAQKLSFLAGTMDQRKSKVPFLFYM